MKLSLAWILDHIHGISLADINPTELVARLTTATAEIEGYRVVTFKPEHFTLARCESVAAEQVTVSSIETSRRYTLPIRDGIVPGAWYLVYDDKKSSRWGSYADFSSTREALLPPFTVPQGHEGGGWKEQCELTDIILELDNKAITHRPDLWGHRGFAREIAALYKFSLTSEDRLYTDVPVRHGAAHGLDVRIEPDAPCKRLAALSISDIDQGPSYLSIAHRLARLDARAHDRIVDFTNYVMFDIGQPMHAFDGAKLEHDLISADTARPGEFLTLLDGTTITAQGEEGVIRDGKRAIALAGIMGGASTAVDLTTREVVIEAGTFDPAVIRKTSLAHKKRTEASARFEKTLDPHQNTQALLRFVRLLRDYHCAATIGDAIVSRGELPQERVITISHDFITRRIGTALTADMIIQALKSLEFGVVQSGAEYTITVPSFRATKDIASAYDCVEEIARMIGYNTLIPVLPERAMVPHDLTQIRRLRILKELCAAVGAMHEVSTYALIDEEFLARLGCDVSETIELKNPLSERARRLVPSLAIHLMKIAAHNAPRHPQARFFEINKTWSLRGDGAYDETRRLAGIITDTRAPLDFYVCKSILETIFDRLALRVMWRKAEGHLYPWMSTHQTAELLLNDTLIGYAGMVDRAVYGRVAEGNAWIFEVASDAITVLPHDERVYHEPSRYQPVDRDVSLFIPRERTVAELEEAIALTDARVINVQLIDIFDKDEWKGQRAVTLRVTLSDHDEQLTHPVIEEIWGRITRALTDRGGVVR